MPYSLTHVPMTTTATMIAPIHVWARKFLQKGPSSPHTMTVSRATIATPMIAYVSIAEPYIAFCGSCWNG